MLLQIAPPFEGYTYYFKPCSLFLGCDTAPFRIKLSFVKTLIIWLTTRSDAWWKFPETWICSDLSEFCIIIVNNPIQI